MTEKCSSSADFSRYETKYDNYWCEGLNIRTGETLVFVENINFVDMPVMHVDMLPVRHLSDKTACLELNGRL
jgi:hypothetical protein